MMRFTMMDDQKTIRAECDCGDSYFLRFVNLEDTPVGLQNVSIRNYYPTKEEIERWTA